MFIGHFAPAFVAAARPQAAGLGTLFVAAQLVDIGFAALLVPGIEAMRITPGIAAMNPMDLYHMPYTHSLLGTAAWAALFGLAVQLVTQRKAAAISAALVVLSHWFIDLLVHVPDLTLHGAPPKIGLGLWNHPAVAMPLEILLVGAAFLYMRGARAATVTIGGCGCWRACSPLRRPWTGSGRKSPPIRWRFRRRCWAPMRCSRERHGGRARTAG